jgi:transposase
MADGRRRRRIHSDEFKANAVAACQQVGVSIAAVAMAHGINANLLRRWVQDSETSQCGELANTLPAAKAPATKAQTAFVPMQLPAPAPPAGEIRIEVRRGEMTLTVVWPAAAATECSAWMRELLR